MDVPFQRFLDEQSGVVWRFLVASVGPHDADDCFQETFLSALQAYPRLRPGSNARAWVLTIAQRKAIDHVRARGRRAVPSDRLPDVAVHDPPPEDGALWRRVAGLPPRQRAAVTLRVAGELSHAEVAEVLGISEDAARRAAHDGLKKLREELMPCPT